MASRHSVPCDEQTGLTLIQLEEGFAYSGWDPIENNQKDSPLLVSLPVAGNKFFGSLTQKELVVSHIFGVKHVALVRVCETGVNGF